MKYPDALIPNATETFLLPRSGKREEIAEATPTFVEWDDPVRRVKKTYGGKAVLNLDGEPYFAELAIRKIFVDAGWDGVWVDKSKYRVGYDYFDEGKSGDFFVSLPKDKSRLLNEIYEASGTPHSGCWDVFCWKGDEVAFIESKRKDDVRSSQDLWLEAALQVGVSRSSFLVVKWSPANLRTPPETSSVRTSESSGRATPEVREMISDEETAATFPVMGQLRPHLEEGEYVGRIGRMRETGYRLAAVLDDEGQVRCVAGFRVHDFLYTGKHLYVDDLVTDEATRSGGHGKRMLDWLAAEAKRSGCEQLHLDSGVQREGAHRFYFREGMRISSYHFVKEL